MALDTCDSPSSCKLQHVSNGYAAINFGDGGVGIKDLLPILSSVTVDVTQSFAVVSESTTHTASEVLYQPLTTTEILNGILLNIS